jgi:putative glutamine amidotransferase
MTSFETLLWQQSRPLVARLARHFGDHELAQDALQEARLRAWRAAPRDLPADRLQAWLHRVARNAAVDELRRRGRRSELPLHDAAAVVSVADEDERGWAVTAALRALTPHHRMLLLLRFEAGLSLAEIGALLDVSEDAARKRVARARTAFRDALREAERADDRPTVAVLLARDEPAVYRAWLERAGARVRIVDLAQPGLDLAGADALVLSGSTLDIHPRTYGAARDPRCIAPDLDRDLRDLAAIRAALRDDVPLIGVCRGAQLLNVLFGGTLVQHIDHHAGDCLHAVRTESGSAVASALGARPRVVSDHHQAVARLGRGLHVTATAPDGLAEAVEVPGRRLAVGLQWHPERGGGEGLADLLVATAAA